MQVAGPGAPAPTTPAPSAADSAALTGLKQAIAQKQQQIQQLSGLSSERANKVADNMRADLKILQDRHDRLEDRLTEGPRAVARETALQPLKLAQQRAGAEVSLEAKANEPIGVDNGRKMGLPPATRWKDVPKDVRVLEDPSPGERQKFSDYKASQAGIGRVLTMLEQPGAQKIIGTLFSEPENTFNRRLGEWLSTVSPEQRKFVASMAAEIAEIRHALSGAAVSPQEFANLKPMMPSADDPDVATVRAKLEALQEWIVRKHDAYRDQLDQVGIRTPKALERPAEPPKPGPNVDKFKKLVQ
jgi:hypothetical protein